MQLNYNEHIKQWDHRRLIPEYKKIIIQILDFKNDPCKSISDRERELSYILKSLHTQFKNFNNFHDEIKTYSTDMLHNEIKELIKYTKSFLDKKPDLEETQIDYLLKKIVFFEDLIKQINK